MVSTLLHPISHIIKDYNGVILTAKIENQGANISGDQIGLLKVISLIPLIII
jgi:hypothetical protein